MSDEERHEYPAPPPPPLFGRGGPIAGPNPKRVSESELDHAVDRHHQEEDAEGARRPWWKRLLGRS